MGISSTDQSSAKIEISNLILKVLHFIEVSRPMKGAVCGAAVTAQRDRVTESFTKSREVPGPTILSAVIVTGGAGDVLLECNSGVCCVVEMLFPE